MSPLTTTSLLLLTTLFSSGSTFSLFPIKNQSSLDSQPCQTEETTCKYNQHTICYCGDATYQDKCCPNVTTCCPKYTYCCGQSCCNYGDTCKLDGCYQYERQWSRYGSSALKIIGIVAGLCILFAFGATKVLHSLKIKCPVHPSHRGEIQPGEDARLEEIKSPAKSLGDEAEEKSTAEKSV
ncbi:uncharacterized protein LOC110862685 [Folsomia candida]|uniref:Uncharacterized protein n=1 Tax=Folsomia candida TaxID=158441 RepID=A0A226CX22_FOLCA|nr:uncharacterized protein LOC110862685 [Folsomia candida]OXA37057.1 hypothetical protein Fcan01_28157 [Folsomia candida]